MLVEYLGKKALVLVAWAFCEMQRPKIKHITADKVKVCKILPKVRPKILHRVE